MKLFLVTLLSLKDIYFKEILALIYLTLHKLQINFTIFISLNILIVAQTIHMLYINYYIYTIYNIYFILYIKYKI